MEMSNLMAVLFTDMRVSFRETSKKHNDFTGGYRGCPWIGGETVRDCPPCLFVQAFHQIDGLDGLTHHGGN